MQSTPSPSQYPSLSIVWIFYLAMAKSDNTKTNVFFDMLLPPLTIIHTSSQSTDGLIKTPWRLTGWCSHLHSSCFSLLISNESKVHSWLAPLLGLCQTQEYPRNTSIMPLLQLSLENHWHFLRCSHPPQDQLYLKLKKNLESIHLKATIGTDLFAYSGKACSPPECLNPWPCLIISPIQYNWDQLMYDPIAFYGLTTLQTLARDPHMGLSSTPKLFA